ncbi:MAG: S8 family serine peptidase [Firmicutes bacterium]|nr:S8 family serine peptidase [Bacillota bacterium]
MKRKFFAVLLSVMLIMCMMPAMAFADGEAAETEGELFYPNTDFSSDQYVQAKTPKETEADGVLVLYKAGKVNTITLPNIDRSSVDVKTAKSFGKAMAAISKDGKAEAINTLADQKRILDKALKSYTIKDTLVYKGSVKAPVISGDSVISLVSSNKYSAEELAAILNEQDDILLAEPNYKCHALGPAGTGAGDPTAKYAYQTQVMNTQVVKDAIPQDSENEVVVAIIDTGVDYNHEELAETMWVNPGYKDLSGTYGYDFVYKDADPMDENGHGTHCAGIIAAQAKNDVGTLGIAGDVPNVKIMALRFLDESGSGDLNDALAAYCYIIRALDDGVNVVAINNSWGAALGSGIFNKVIDMAGEKGAVSFIASGNDAYDNDLNLNSPANEPSAYSVVVDSLNEKLLPSSYTCYGRKTTDVGAPGTNIISSVCYDNYMPFNYSKEQLEETSTYYGEFDETTVIDENGNVTPTVGTDVNGESNEGAVKALGTSVMKSSLAPGSEGTMSLELGEPSAFNYDGESRDSSTSRTLEWTISNPSLGDVYLLYFPYEKESGVQILSSYLNITFHTIDDPDSIPYPGLFLMGDVGYRSEDANGNVTVDENPFYMMDDEAYYMLGATDSTYDDIFLGSQTYARCSEYTESHFGDADGVRFGGIGLMYKVESPEDVTFCIDSLGVAKKDADPETFGKYDIYSGTSMATPAACAAGALLAAAYPDADALDLKTMLLASVTQTEELYNTCTSGGYIDFKDFDIEAPAAGIYDYKVNFNKSTVTLYGKNLGTEKGSVAYERPHSDISGTVDPANITWSKDKITIKNAKDLISCDVNFIITTASGRSSQTAFYTVKGETPYTNTAKLNFYYYDDDDFFFFEKDKDLFKNALTNNKDVSTNSEAVETLDEILALSGDSLEPVNGADLPYFIDPSGAIYLLDETPVEGEDDDDEDYDDWAAGKRVNSGLLTKAEIRRGTAEEDSEETAVPFNNLWTFGSLSTLLSYTDNFKEWTKLEREAGMDTSSIVPDLVSNAVYCGGRIYEEIKLNVSGRDIYALIAFDPMAQDFEDMVSVIYDSTTATSGVTPDDVDKYATLAALNGKIYMIGGFNSEEEHLDGCMSVKTYVIDPLAKAPVWKDTGTELPNYMLASVPGGFAKGYALTQNNKIYYVMGCDMTSFVLNVLYANIVYPFNDHVLEFDGKEWKQLDTKIPYPIRTDLERSASVGITDGGLIFSGMSTDGGGDTFIYKTGADVTDRIEKVNYTINGEIYESFGFGTTVGAEQFFIAPDMLDDWGELYNIYKIPLTSNPYGRIDWVQTGKGKGFVYGAGTYTLGETAKIVVVPNETSFIKSVKVDGKKITVKDPTRVTSTIKSVGESHLVEVEFGTYKISKATVTVAAATYTGKALKPKVTVKLEGKTLKSGTDYTLTYTKNKNIGKGKVTVTGKGKYSGKKTVTFKINPAKVKGLKATGGNKSIKVSFTKGKGTVKYQISYRVKGSSSWKKVTSTKTSYTIKSLKAGKTYQVKVRAFKKVSGTTYYGKWSSTATAEVKE